MAATVQTPVGRAPIVPVILLGTGLYLAWFAVSYWGSDTEWPTDPLKDVLQGKPLPTPSGQTSAASIAAGVEAANAANPSAIGPGVAGGGTAPTVSGNYTIPELETLWTSQGGSGQTAFAAANVAMAESGGNPMALGPSSNPSGAPVGLWQLTPLGVGAGYTVAQLQDPATNALITIMHTANGTVWTEWADAVVKNGVYIGPKV